MKIFILLFSLIVHVLINIKSEPGLEKVLLYIKHFDFDQSKKRIKLISDAELEKELLKFNEMLYYAGQKDSSFFVMLNNPPATDKTILACVQMLNKGYFELYYHKTKSEAFKFFYQALDIAKRLKNVALHKAALLALLEYYHFEIAQNSLAYEQYLQEYEKLSTDEIDQIWIILYRLIFYSKTLEQLDGAYFDWLDQLDKIENSLPPNNKLLPKIYFEKGLGLDLEGNLSKAKEYYIKAFESSEDLPYLRSTRFSSLIKLSTIAQKENDYKEALQIIMKAKKHVDLADTLRSNYYLNLYSSMYYNDLKKFDSAYFLLTKAYKADFYLDFRRNTLEISRLNVVLQTQQKELENLNLRQNKIWLIVALSIVGLLLVLSYLAYTNIRSKKRIVEKEKEIQTQNMEKLLKEQELLGIDAMIAGQEKERQRIANEVHDNLGSLLATVKYHVQNLRIKLNGPGAEDALLDKTDDLIEEAYQKVRSIAHVRNAGVHAQEGLLPAVKNFASKVSVSNKLRIDVIDHGMDERLENSLEITLFRIIQELITNIIKHSGAGEAAIHLTHHELSINMLVEDNGKGFEYSELKTGEGMGLYSIRKRVENLQGELTVESLKDKGTTVIIDIPLI